MFGLANKIKKEISERKVVPLFKGKDNYSSCNPQEDPADFIIACPKEIPQDCLTHQENISEWTSQYQSVA